jgi:hypothetical protein
LRDPFTMYKVFRRDCIYGFGLTAIASIFDHEIVGKLVRNGFNPIEIDVSYHCRSFAEGKKISIFRRSSNLDQRLPEASLLAAARMAGRRGAACRDGDTLTRKGMT